MGTVAEAEYRSPVEVLGIRAPADFLSLWLQTGEEAYASLYRGICVAELSALPAGAVADWAPRTALMLGAVDQRHPLSSPGRAKLEGLLRDVHANLPTQSERLEEATAWAGVLGRWFQAARLDKVRVLGPAAAPIVRLKRIYRYHFVLKAEKRQALGATLRAMLAYAETQGVARRNLVVDVDAVHLM